MRSMRSSGVFQFILPLPGGSLVSFGVVGCARACPACRWFNQRSLGSLGYALGVDGFSGHSRKRWKLLRSLRLFGFTRVLPSGR